jgi:hypothetical protein
MAGRKMHQTTVRFGPDLWEEIEVEAARSGVSVAQYVRDATLMRVAYTRGREAEPHYGAALESVAGAGDQHLRDVRARAASNVQDSLALLSENRQAVRKARSLREQFGEQREQKRQTAEARHEPG